MNENRARKAVGGNRRQRNLKNEKCFSGSRQDIASTKTAEES